jgi:hypothetical protein
MGEFIDSMFSALARAICFLATAWFVVLLLGHAPRSSYIVVAGIVSVSAAIGFDKRKS